MASLCFLTFALCNWAKYYVNRGGGSSNPKLSTTPCGETTVKVLWRPGQQHSSSHYYVILVVQEGEPLLLSDRGEEGRDGCVNVPEGANRVNMIRQRHLSRIKPVSNKILREKMVKPMLTCQAPRFALFKFARFRGIRKQTRIAVRPLIRHLAREIRDAACVLIQGRRFQTHRLHS